MMNAQCDASERSLTNMGFLEEHVRHRNHMPEIRFAQMVAHLMMIPVEGNGQVATPADRGIRDGVHILQRRKGGLRRRQRIGRASLSASPIRNAPRADW